MKVLVCGGRTWGEVVIPRGAPPHLVEAARAHAKAQKDTLCRVLDDFAPPITFLIQGGARGADRCALEWVMAKRLPNKTYKANWERHGRAAGPIRNQFMLDDGKPDLVLAFPGGDGTADMVSRAQKGGYKVVEVKL